VRRRLVLALLLAAPAITSTADPLTAARAEAAAAAREQARLEASIAAAGGTQARLQAEQAAAAQGLVASEAALALARVQTLAAQAELDRARRRLDTAQQPAALLLAGLTQYGRRPPLLALAAGRTVSDIVHLRALVESTLPFVEARTGGLRQELAQSEEAKARLASAHAEAAARAQDLRARQQRFAALETTLNQRLAALGGAALGAGDVALADLAAADTAAGRAAAQQEARRTARALSALADAPPRPLPPRGPTPARAFHWQVPVAGPILGGLGEISTSGVRARGLTIGSASNAPVVMPAAGTIVFSGPFRRHVSVIVIDHGGGWMTLMTEVRTSLPTGVRLAPGEPLGRALGVMTVELSKDGRPQPAALIAGSSPLLSKAGQPS